MEGSLSKGERQRLAGLAAATANGLLVMFVLAVALPLIPPKLADPFWLLAFTGTFCSNGFLALLADRPRRQPGLLRGQLQLPPIDVLLAPLPPEELDALEAPLPS